MKRKENILKKTGKASYGIPEGYFDSLKVRLEAIPAEKKSERSVRPDFLARVKPYVTLAACFAIAVMAGNAILRNTAGSRLPDDSYTDLFYADLVPVTQPDEIFQVSETETETLTDEDIINYLIETGASEDQLEYVGQN